MICVVPDCSRPARDLACGPHWALACRDLPLDSKRSVCAIPGCPYPHWALGYCRAHHSRLIRGGDLYAPMRHRRTGREPMRPVLRPDEQEALWEVLGQPMKAGKGERGQGRTGGVVSVKRWASEDRQAEQLGTPEMWQQIADEALERAWADLLDPSRDGYRARLAALRPAKPRVVQSPLLVPIRTGSKSGVMRIRSCA